MVFRKKKTFILCQYCDIKISMTNHSPIERRPKMIPQKKPMEIIRETGIYRCVKLNRKYYCIAWDEAANKTSAIVKPDRVLGELRSFDGYSHAAVEYVAKGRKRSTAIAYFNEFLRSRKRVGLPQQQRRVLSQETTHEEPQPICSWCNGSGLDYRNVEWSCTKC